MVLGFKAGSKGSEGKQRTLTAPSLGEGLGLDKGHTLESSARGDSRRTPDMLTEGRLEGFCVSRVLWGLLQGRQRVAGTHRVVVPVAAHILHGSPVSGPCDFGLGREGKGEASVHPRMGRASWPGSAVKSYL